MTKTYGDNTKVFLQTGLEMAPFNPEPVDVVVQAGNEPTRT